MIMLSKTTNFCYKVECGLKPIIDRFNASIADDDHIEISLWAESNGDSSYIDVTKYVDMKTGNYNDDIETTFKVRISNHSPSAKWALAHGAANLYIFVDEKEYTPAKLIKLIIKKFELAEFKKG